MDNNVFAVILAAGQASRFGDLKQLEAVGDRPMVVRAVQTARAACGDRTVLVTGHEARRIAQVCAGLGGFVVVNEDHDDGIGSSIATAAMYLRHAADALVVLLADQPFVTAEHLRSLVDLWDGTENRIVASRYAGTRGPPVLFDRACFAELAALRGDSGAHSLFADPRFDVRTIDFEPAAVDVDTPADLRRISRNARS